MGPKEEAKAIAKNLKENYPGWKDQLPDCPCTQEEIEKSDLFESANFRLSTYHPGAANGYRSSEPVEIKSTVNPELPSLDAGQQCTFDTKGDLITHGIAAGTPDAYSPSKWGNVLDHNDTDVFPYKNLSTKEYLKEWKPNNDNNCPENWGDNLSKPEQETEPENQNPSLDSNPESDRTDESENNQQPSLDSNQEDNLDTPENTQPEAETNLEVAPEFETDSEEELGAVTETQAWNFNSFSDESEASSETSESFGEADSFEKESFAEGGSELFESFAESSSASFESFAESSVETSEGKFF